MSRFGIDFAWHGEINITKLKQAGVTFVERYLSPDNSKNLHLGEAIAYSTNGIDNVVVYESTAARALGGFTAGVADAKLANAQAKGCGQPPGRPIYFGVDFDATTLLRLVHKVAPKTAAKLHERKYGAQLPTIARYFDGVASVIGRDRTGAYAGYWVIKGLAAGGHITWADQTYAWSGGNWHSLSKTRGFQQYSNSHTIAGIDCDFNRAYCADFGQWKVGHAPAPAGPLPAKQFNAPGEKHHDVWARPVNAFTPLYYPNGVRTGQYLPVTALLWPDHEGTVQLDLKERVEAGGRRYVFARGGYIPGHAPQPYGHVWVNDLHRPLGAAVAAGDDRGAPAPLAKRRVTLVIQPIPDIMGYKPGGASDWATYGDAGAKYGYPGKYSYMLWSAPRTEAGNDLGDVNHGGGIVRALVPVGGHLELCDVGRLHCASVDAAGKRNGTVVLAYCERSGLYGWVVVAHQLAGQPFVHHIV